MSFLPWTTFARIVDRYDGDRSVRALGCTEHYRAMAFAQLTGRESLRDIEACLAARSAKLYHSGAVRVLELSRGVGGGPGRACAEPSGVAPSRLDDSRDGAGA